MIEIKKDKEPTKLLAYRQTKNASYEEMDSDVKKDLLDKLLKEQGHLCAYCMKKIPEKKHVPSGISPVTIEHWYPRNPDEKKDIGQGLNYKNMFAVCSGNRGCGNKEYTTCDAHRGNVPLKINPCNPDTINTIYYTSSGKIKSTDPVIDKDLDITLNLNSTHCSLPENRRRVLNELIQNIARTHPKGDISLYCKRRLEAFENETDPKTPYSGILIWWLKNHLTH